MKMTWAYRAVAYVNGAPAGVVGIYLRRRDYAREARPNAPAVRFERIAIEAHVAERMRAGASFADAVRATKG